jgi:hypothetical protein
MSISVEKVKTALRQEDVEGYIEYHGAPRDEYDSEAEYIASLLQSETSLTEDGVLDILARVWVEYFNLDDQDMAKRMPYLKKVAKFLVSG